MSFGKSYMVRFAAAKQAGKTEIFWEQENARKPKKKTNYKTRDQPFPLRTRPQQEAQIEPEPSVPVHKAAPAPKQPKNSPQVKQRKPPGYTTRPRNERTEGSDTKGGGAVTLTQAELTTILASIGKVSKDNPLRISINKDTNHITIEEEDIAAIKKKKKKKPKDKDKEENVEDGEDESDAIKKKKKKEKDGDDKDNEVESKPKKKQKNKVKKSEEFESIYHLIGLHDDDDDDDKEEDNDDNGDVDETVADDGDDEVDDDEEEIEMRRKAKKTKTKKKEIVVVSADDEDAEAVEDSKENKMNKKLKKADETDEDEKKRKKNKRASKKRKKESEEEKEREVVDPSTPKAEEQKPPMYLSISEKKRLQWEKERAEQMADFNPWGKPGAGAPIKDSTGEILADYNARKEDETEGRKQPKKQQVVEEQKNLISPRYTDRKITNKYSPENVTLTSSPYVDQSKLPAAMRSSFALGGAVANNDRLMSTKELEKKKWLEDLERQIEEKKMQKVGEKVQNQDVEDTWADRLSNSKPASLPVPEQEAKKDQDMRASTAPKEDILNDSGPFPVQFSTFIRGQNAMIDPVTMQELAEKRRRHLEHQQAIQEQVEERQRLKRQERERKIREEQEEERKLQMERDKLQRQYEMEQMKQKKKEFEQELRVQKLKEAFDQAEQDAIQEKHFRRMQYLKQHGHDVSHLHKSFEAKYTPRAPTTMPDSNFVPGLDLTSRHNDFTLDTERAITPLKLRHNSEPDILSAKKEFGVQTDFNDLVGEAPTLNDTTKNRENSAGIQYKGPIVERRGANKGREKKVRLRSASSAPASKEKRPPPANEMPPRPRKPALKPRWNEPQKKARSLKQSEKDPLYQRRRQEAEQRRMKREQKLLAMQEANMKRIPASERGKSRSPSVGRRSEHEHRQRDPSPELQIADITPRSHRRSRLDGHHSHVTSHTPENPPSVLRTRVSRSPQAQRHTAVETPTTSVHVASVRARSKSPPVPAVRHRLQGADENSPKHFDTLGDHRGHYSDLLPSHAPVDDGDFVPFLRSSAFLDPADSQMPLPVSREMTRVEQGRKAYAQGLKPGDFGSRMEHIQDTGLEKVLPDKKTLKDPIMNPSLVKDHPTARQDIILQQLSDIRKNLLQRQREIETCLQPGEVTASSNLRGGME